MNPRNSINGIILLLLISSCNNQNSPENITLTVDIESEINNMRQINLSKFTDDICYIVLENKPDISISDYPSFDLSDNLLLTHDRESSLLLFNISGNLIVKFGNRGRGPEEYQSINNLSFGLDNKVYFNSMTDLFEFNPDGSFSSKYPNFLLAENAYYLHQWSFVDDSLLFGHIQNDNGQTRYKAFLIDRYGTVKRYYLNYDLLENKGSRVMGGSTQIHKYRGKLYFKEQFNDTLFYLNSKYDLIPEYLLNLGDLKMPASLRVNFNEYFKQINNYVAIEDIFQTEDYLFLNVNLGNRFPAKRINPRSNESSSLAGVIQVNDTRKWYNTTACLGIYDKKNKELLFCEPTSTDNPLYTSGIYNDIDAGPRFLPRKLINDSIMVMTISAKDLKYHIESDEFKSNIPKYPEKKRQLEELAVGLSEFDNPVLMLVTLNRK